MRRRFDYGDEDFIDNEPLILPPENNYPSKYNLLIKLHSSFHSQKANQICVARD